MQSVQERAYWWLRAQRIHPTFHPYKLRNPAKASVIGNKPTEYVNLDTGEIIMLPY